MPSIMGAVAKHVFLVTDPTKLEATVRTAFEIARTGRPGPVVLDIPKDVQNWKGVFHGSGRLPIPGYRQRMNRLEASKLPEAACAAFFAALAQAERPLIYAGGGRDQRAARRRRCANSRGNFSIPVVTTLMGIGAVDTTDPLSMRMLGMHGAAFANYAVDDCDFLMAVGARFDDRVAGNPQKFAEQRQVHRAPRHRRLRDQQGQAGRLEPRRPDARRPARPSLGYGRRRGIQARLVRLAGALRRAAQARHAMNYDRESALIQPYYVIEEINRLTRGEAVITTGVGQHQMWAAQYFDFSQPAAVADVGQHGHHGFRPAGGGRRAVRAAQPAGDRHRRRRQHPHEPRRARDRHHLRSAGQGRGAQQLRRRHGQAVAEAVFQGPLERQRQEPAHQGFRQGGARRRIQVRGAPRQEGRRAARRRGVHPLRGRRRSSRS